MNFHCLHPRQQLANIMHRIYRQGMTTLSGGNLSILDENGDMWITPASTDKGKLTPQDIVCVKAGGSTTGPHRPSSEYPFHKAVYARRPDLRAIVHCHSPALVSFSIVRQLPDTQVLPSVFEVCGQVGYAPYALTGTDKLGQIIAGTFAEGFDTVLLENHGIVTGGDNLLTAFGRLETVDFCARTLLQARKLGRVNTLTQKQLALARNAPAYPGFTPAPPGSREQELRRQIVDMVQRAYQRQLMTGTQGAVSARLKGHNFLINAAGTDRHLLTSDDIVLIRNGQAEADKQPSRYTRLHETIYKRQPGINFIMTAQPPHIMAYALTSTPFNTRTMFESYYLLQDVPLISFDAYYQTPQLVAQAVAGGAPVVLIQNDCVVTTGTSLLQTFDRLEVAESSARVLLDAAALGQVIPLSDEQIHEVDVAFFSGDCLTPKNNNLTA
jgi:L-fuculose-phosphate aldolase